MGWACGMEDGRSPFKILTGKPTGKGTIERTRQKWEDNIRMDLRKQVSIWGIGLFWLPCEWDIEILVP